MPCRARFVHPFAAIFVVLLLLWQSVLFPLLASGQLADGGATTTHYNAIGKVDYTVDALRRVTTHKYNNLGQRYETIYPDGTQSLTFYDENGQNTRGKDRSGRGSKTLYDSLGRATANLSLGTSGQNFKHENGNVIQSVTEYDDAGQAVATQDELGHISRTKYNAAGEAYQSTIYDQNNAGDLVPLTSSSQHDKAGRTTRSTDALGRYSVPQYDDGGRVRFMRLYDAEDKLLSTSETHYDALGRVDYTIDASNHMKRMVYDNLSRLVAVIQATQGQPTADGSGPYDLVTSFGYDELGQKIWQADANKRVTRFGYDVRGRQVWRRLPMGEMETMDYNVGGQLTRSTDFRGYTTTYTYDERGRTKTKTPDQRLLDRGESPLSWDYPDENTRIAYRGSASVTQFYDAERGWLDRVENKVGAQTSVVSYSYNPEGQKTATNTASGSTFYSYDVLGRLATVRDQTVDSTTNTPVDIARYDYNEVGNLTSLERSNGVNTRYTFDEQNRLDMLTNKRGTSVVSSFDYTVRGDGKRTDIVEQLLNADGRTSARNIAFNYDAAGKLTFERGQNGLGAAYENTWTYDAVGNRTGTTAYRNDVAGATQSWAHETVVTSRFNENDQLTSQTSVVDQSSMLTQSYTYDENGAEKTVASKSGNAVTGSSVNGWDFEGKLRTTQAKDAEGDADGGSSNVFDAQGDRLWHVADVGKPTQKTTSYVVDTDTSYAQVVEETSHDVKDSAGAARLQARYVWGQGLAPLAMWRRMPNGAVKLFYFVADGQESVRQLTDTTGAVTDSYFYDAWGNTLAGGSGNTANPFRYTGQQLDSDGRYYLRARFYNPGNGRFLSHDPLMGFDEDPVSMHRYLYAGADGVNFLDPSGTMTTAEVSATLVVASTIFGGVAGYATFEKLGGNGWDGAITGARLGFALSFGYSFEPELMANAVTSGFSNAVASMFGYGMSNFAKGGTDNPFLHHDFAGRLAIEAIKGFTSGLEAVLYGGMVVKKLGGDELQNVDEVAAAVCLSAMAFTFVADFAGGERNLAKLFTNALAQGIYAGMTTWAVGHNTSLSPAAARKGSLQISQSLVNAAAPLLSATANVYLPWLDLAGPPDYPTNKNGA